MAIIIIIIIPYRLAALFVDSVANLLVDHLTLLLSDGLSHSLALLLLFALAVFLVDNVAPGITNIFPDIQCIISSPLVDDSVAILSSVSGADLVDNIGALLFHALRALLLVDNIKDLGADLLRHIPADFLK